MEENRQTTVVMTEETAAKFAAFLQQEKAEEAKAAAKQMRADYKEMVDDAIKSNMPGLMKVSAELAAHKKRVFDEFSTIIQMKAEMFKMEKDSELDNMSHHFTSSDGTMKIVLGNYVTDGYLDTAEAGIAKVHEYLTAQASDDKSQKLVKMVLRLLAKDSKGTLKASRIIQLRKMAEESGDADFIEGVKIIEEAYQPQTSRTYLKAYVKNAETKAWEQIPLGMTEA